MISALWEVGRSVLGHEPRYKPDRRQRGQQGKPQANPPRRTARPGVLDPVNIPGKVSFLGTRANPALPEPLAGPGEGRVRCVTTGLTPEEIPPETAPRKYGP